MLYNVYVCPQKYTFQNIVIFSGNMYRKIILMHMFVLILEEYLTNVKPVKNHSLGKICSHEAYPKPYFCTTC